MEARKPCHIYDGELWTLDPTVPDTNSFFHSVFGYKSDEKELCTYKYVQDKRTDWSKFLSSFESEAMPPHLADALRKCLSATDKYKNVSIEDKVRFSRYVADIAAAEQPVTMEDISILAALCNIKFVILSKTEPDPITIIGPDLEIPERHRKNIDGRFKETQKVIVCLEGSIFSKAKIADDNLRKQYQVDRLFNHWRDNLNIEETNRSKCERYATVLVNKIPSWTKTCHSLQNHFTDVQLQLTMLTEVFQDTSRLDKTPDWEGCKEYLSAGEGEPKLPEKMSLVKLFDIFVIKRRNTFMITGNSNEENQPPVDQFEECLACHRILATEMTIGKAKRQLFSIDQQSDTDVEANVLKIGVVEKVHNEFRFIHETFKAYFVAQSLLKELQLDNQRADFQRFLFEEILSCPEFNVVRAFIDGRLETDMDSLPSNIFQNYQSLKCDVDLQKKNLQCTIHLLAKEGCTAILRLLLKCMNFKVARGKKITVTDDRDSYFDKSTWRHIFSNPFNVLLVLVRQGGVNIMDVDNNMPLHYAAEKGYVETARFLVERGANVNSLNRKKYTALHLAILEGHEDVAKLLVQAGANVRIPIKKLFGVYSVRNENHMALHLAAKTGQRDVVKFLLEHGAHVNMKHDNGPTALHVSISEGHVNVTKYLLDQGADITIKRYESIESYRRTSGKSSDSESEAHADTVDKIGSTALHLAVKARNLDVVKFLLERGAGINMRNRQGNSPLHLAAFIDDNLDIIKCLLENGADINVKDEEGCTPLYVALDFGKMNVAELLLNCGADINVINKEKFTMIHYFVRVGKLSRIKFLVERGADVNARDGYDPTALHLAVTEDNLEFVKFFVENGARLDIRDDTGRTALHLAVDGDSLDMVNILADPSCVNVEDHLGKTPLLLAASWSSVELLQVLIRRGANVNIPDTNNCTPLYEALSQDMLDNVKVLLEHGANADFSSVKGCKTVLHFAALRCRLDTFKYFVEREQNVDIKGDDGVTSLLLAAKGGQLETVKFLIESGVDLYSRDDLGRTALHIAAKNDQTDILEFLIEATTDVNVRDRDGRTPLHLAAKKDQLRAVEFFIQRVADVNVRDDDGRTALHLAAFRGKLDTVKVLAEAGVDLKIKDNDGCTALHLASLWNASFGLLEFLQMKNRGRKRRSSD